MSAVSRCFMRLGRGHMSLSVNLMRSKTAWKAGLEVGGASWGGVPGQLGWGTRYKCWLGCSGLGRDYLCYVNQAFCSLGPSPRDLSSPWELTQYCERVLLHILFFWQEDHFFFFLNRLYVFYSSSRVSKIKQKKKRFLIYIPPLKASPLPAFPIRVVHVFTIDDEPILTHHHRPKSTVYIKVHSCAVLCPSYENPGLWQEDIAQEWMMRLFSGNTWNTLYRNHSHNV